MTTQIVSNQDQIASGTGTWTDVLAVTQVDTQAGIWLKVPNGNWAYYEPHDKSLIPLVFEACADLQNHNVLVLLPSNAPANGLQVTSGVAG